MREVPAHTAEDLMDLQGNTALLLFRKVGILIPENLKAKASEFAGEIDLDESYFGGAHQGKRWRGAAKKISVFGILKRGGKVHT